MQNDDYDDNEKRNTLPPWLDEYNRLFQYLKIDSIEIQYKDEIWKASWEI